MKVRGISINELLQAVQTKISSTNIMPLVQLEYKENTFADWGRIGLKIIANSCNLLRVSSEFGLLIRWFRVRASGCPLL
jgi:hypothetical protein